MEVTVRSEPQVGVVTTNADGVWSFTPPLPLESGSHSYTARLVLAEGVYGEVVGPVPFQVLGATTPNTGSNMQIYMVAGALLMLVGSGLWLCIRQRKVVERRVPRLFP